jgi:hypothetical protein
MINFAPGQNFEKTPSTPGEKIRKIDDILKNKWLSDILKDFKSKKLIVYDFRERIEAAIFLLEGKIDLLYEGFGDFLTAQDEDDRITALGEISKSLNSLDQSSLVDKAVIEKTKSLFP